MTSASSNAVPAADTTALPEFGRLSTLQVINWLAFGQPVDYDLTGGEVFRQRWGGYPSWTTAEGEPLFLICLRLTAGHRTPSESWIFSSQMAEELFAQAEHLQEKYGLSPVEMAAQVYRQAHQYHERMAILQQAQGALIPALVSGRIRAKAVAQADDGRPRLATQVAPETFGTPGIELMLDGAIRLAGESIFVGAYFLAEEVRTAWGPIGSTPPGLPLSPTKTSRRGIGGRKPKHDWRSFAKEMVRRAALDGGDLGQEEFRDHMRAWAVENMDTFPDEKTVDDAFWEMLPENCFKS